MDIIVPKNFRSKCLLFWSDGSSPNLQRHWNHHPQLNRSTHQNNLCAWLLHLVLSLSIVKLNFQWRRQCDCYVWSFSIRKILLTSNIWLKIYKQDSLVSYHKLLDTSYEVSDKGKKISRLSHHRADLRSFYGLLIIKYLEPSLIHECQQYSE